MNEQRGAKRRGILTEERFRRLEEIGFRWDAPDTWEEMFAALAEFNRKHGHCNVSQCSTNPELGCWVANQRQRKKRDQLNVERIERLERLGFIWNTIEAQWEEMFAALLEYKLQNGDPNVPMGWVVNPRLSRWVHQQRQSYKTGNLSEDRVQRLISIGFLWEPREVLWVQNFQALGEFKHMHGNCVVPYGWSDNRQLATWVTSQRRRRKRGDLSDDRVRLLDEIGFVWDTREAYWEECSRPLLNTSACTGIATCRSLGGRTPSWHDG